MASLTCAYPFVGNIHMTILETFSPYYSSAVRFLSCGKLFMGTNLPLLWKSLTGEGGVFSGGFDISAFGAIQRNKSEIILIQLFSI